MSAFMCSDLHLSVLAIYACQQRLWRYVDSRLDLDPLAREKALFRLLARENAASLDARYPGDRDGAQAAELVQFDEKARRLLRDLSLVSLIKQCHCYAYQACEHRGWEDSEAKRVVDNIVSHAIQALPGYEEASWGL